MAFAGTVTVAGTVTEAWLLLRWIVNPPLGAAIANVTVPLKVVPAGLTFDAAEIVVRAEASITRVTDTLELPSEALMTTNFCEVTAAAVNGNVAEVAPAGIVTEVGHEAPAPADSLTVSLVSTASLSVTVPVPLCRLKIGFGDKTTDETVCAHPTAEINERK